MGRSFHHRRRAWALPLLAAVAVLTAPLAAAVQVASAGEPPCPSCPDRYPPPSGGGSGSGSGAGAIPAQPLISLDPISVSGGIASVSGTVQGAVGGAASVAARVRVTINGAVAGVSAAGTFSASTSLAAHGGVVVRAGDVKTGATFTISIPASAIPTDGVAADALAQLDADRVTLLLPPDGFTIVDGVAISAGVRVGQTTGIAGLTLNGADLLAQLRVGGSAESSTSKSGSTKPGGVKAGQGAPPSAHHNASATVSGKSTKVRLTVTATNGASQTTTVRVKRVRSVIRIGRQFSISAFGARGIRISSVTFNYALVRSTRQLGVAVTVRDLRRYLVRDAVVTLQPASGRTTIGSSAVRMSSRLGRATFSVPVGSAALGHKLYLKVVAETPRSNTHVTVSTSLPGIAR